MKDVSDAEQNLKSENQFVSQLPEEKNSENFDETFEAPEPLVTGDLFPEDFFPSAQDENKSLDETEIKIGNLQDQLDNGKIIASFKIFFGARESFILTNQNAAYIFETSIN